MTTSPRTRSRRYTDCASGCSTDAEGAWASMAIRRPIRPQWSFALAVLVLLGCSRDATPVKRPADETRPAPVRAAPVRAAPGPSGGAIAEFEAISLCGVDGFIVSG